MWDIHRLRLLRELELRGTITQVAAALRYSSSSVSQQLAQLEREVGVVLLEPDGRRVRLTPQGKAVARHAEEIIRLEEQMRARLVAAHDPYEPVRIACIETAMKAVLPRALAMLNSNEPRVAVEVVVTAPEHALDELETRRFDLVIAEQYEGYAREVREGIDYAHLGTDPVRIALPPDSTASSIHELRDLPWVLEPAGSASRHWALQQCRLAKFEPHVPFEAADLDSHVALISTGLAVGILPDLIWGEGSPTVRLIDLPTPLHRELFTAVRHSSAMTPGVISVRKELASAYQREQA